MQGQHSYNKLQCQPVYQWPITCCASAYCGRHIADVCFGVVCQSGRTPVTIFIRRCKTTRPTMKAFSPTYSHTQKQTIVKFYLHATVGRVNFFIVQISNMRGDKKLQQDVRIVKIYLLI